MRLYRGQTYGAPVGMWWTTSRERAEGHGRVRNAWVLLSIDVNGRQALKFKFYSGAGYTDYKIPDWGMPLLSLGANIVGGNIVIKKDP